MQSRLSGLIKFQLSGGGEDSRLETVRRGNQPSSSCSSSCCCCCCCCPLSSFSSSPFSCFFPPCCSSSFPSCSSFIHLLLSLVFLFLLLSLLLHSLPLSLSLHFPFFFSRCVHPINLKEIMAFLVPSETNTFLFPCFIHCLYSIMGC